MGRKAFVSSKKAAKRRTMLKFVKRVFVKWPKIHPKAPAISAFNSRLLCEKSRDSNEECIIVREQPLLSDDAYVEMEWKNGEKTHFDLTKLSADAAYYKWKVLNKRIDWEVTLEQVSAMQDDEVDPFEAYIEEQRKEQAEKIKKRKKKERDAL